MQRFILIHTTPAGKVQHMTCTSNEERKQLANELVAFYLNKGSVEGSQHGELYILNTAEGRAQLLFRDVK
jgi:hypothetical protein